MLKQIAVLLILSLSFNAWSADSSKGSALINAASKGQTKIVESLIAKKISPNAKDKDGNTALFFAITNEQTKTALLLIEKGADLTNIDQLGESALMNAVSVNNLDVIKAVLKKQPSLVNLANSDKQTPIMTAARVGSVETVKILVSAGADVNAKDSLGRTAYDIAKKSQNNAVLMLVRQK